MKDHEARITVGGAELTYAQSMTVRVALGAFSIALTDEGLGDDEHGRRLTEAYLARIAEVDGLILRAIQSGAGLRPPRQPLKITGEPGKEYE